MNKIKNAIVWMDSGQKLILSELATKGLLEMLEDDIEADAHKPMVINDDKNITRFIIFPKHISHIEFE